MSTPASYFKAPSCHSEEAAGRRRISRQLRARPLRSFEILRSVPSLRMTAGRRGAARRSTTKKGYAA